MTIAKKLYFGIGATLLLTLVLGTLAIYNVGVLGTEIDGLAHTSTRALYDAGMINNLTTDIQANTRGMLLRAYLNDLPQMEKYYTIAGADISRTREYSSNLISVSRSPELREFTQSQIVKNLDPVQASVDTMHALILKGNLAGASAYYKQTVKTIGESMSAAGDALYNKEHGVVTTRAEAALERVVPSRNISVLVMVLAFSAGCTVFWVVRGINAVLRTSVSELRSGADQVAGAASQVSSSSQSLAQGASEQAASLEETSASSEEINSMARKNSDNSHATAELLKQSQQKVDQANQYLLEMVTSMGQINDSSGKISKIIKVIDEIAFQTNILALNAAVEAARAGEAGMGFAVVADEVRSLAQRSAQAAKDTAILIENSIAKSGEGKVKVDQVALAIRAITEDSSKARVMIDEVSLGSEEQSRGIDQIGRAISQMEQVTQTTAASAEESAAAAEELSAQSEALQDVIARLQRMVGGSDSPAMTSSLNNSSLRTHRTPFKKATPGMPWNGQAPSLSQGSTRVSDRALEESFTSF